MSKEKYDAQWLTDKLYKNWVQRVPGDKSTARCTACSK